MTKILIKILLIATVICGILALFKGEDPITALMLIASGGAILLITVFWEKIVP